MVKALFPGTFDPIHMGHIDIAERAANLFDEVIVAVYDRPLKNLLFSPEERLEMVNITFEGHPKIRVVPYCGLTVHFARKINAKVIVRGLRVFSDFEAEFRMALANYHLAPEVEIIQFITNEEHTFLSSTTVREIASLGGDVSTMVPPHVNYNLLKKFKDLGECQQVVPFTQLRD